MLGKEEYQIRDIKHMLVKSIEKYSENTAFWMNKNKGEDCSCITYKESFKDICGLGTSLIARGMKDKRIAIVGVNSYEWAISFLATICGAGVAVPLDKELCINELKYFLNTTQCSCVIFSEEFEDVFLQIRNDGVTDLEMLISMDREKGERDILSLQELIDEGKHMVIYGNSDYANVQIKHDELCAIILTAGTTDIPKAVRLSHLNIATELRLVSTALNITENEIFLPTLPLHCAAECICSILLPLYNGASIDCYNEHKQNFKISNIQGYNLTESSSIVALNPQNGSVGCLLAEMKAKISHPDPETGIGEICLAGKNIMMGYCDNFEMTSKVLIDGWLHTGDLGRIDEKGHIYIAGRKDNVIIADNGKIVYPEELEIMLSRIPYIVESMVWSKNSNEDGTPIISATIVADKKKATEKLGTNYSNKELKELLCNKIININEKLPSYKRIKMIVLRNEEFQKNSSNKIYRWYPANRE